MRLPQRASSPAILTTLLLSLVLGFTLTVSASGDEIVYDNGAGGAGGTNTFIFADSDFPQWMADDVTLGSTKTVTGVEWTGQYDVPDNTPPATDDFTIAFFLGDVIGGPFGAPVAEFEVGNEVNRFDSGFDFSGDDVYEFSADINFTMNAGTTYWIAIFDNTVGENDFFAWGATNAGGDSFSSSDLGDNWGPPFPFSMDFRLTVVPEPSSAAFLGICLIGSWMRRRRR